ncbi:hypothetical protein [Occallatibacter savannae]|uniref:hypothetical protein n=1 Tax=Occallatibacter savannae TaxID=1002691 RepID=UPI000D695480|nr:hypothetical protein [Occallatibacter savannae]
MAAATFASPALSQGTYPTPAPGTSSGQTAVAAPTPIVAPSPALRMMQEFKDTDVKFDMNELVDILRDRRHEGWVLAAYPDPRTAQPLIGAGFSLDLPEREHPQLDANNPHPFLEPSSADLWQAAGFDPARLDQILTVFYERRRTWTRRTWRKKLFSLPAQISDDDAIQLVRVGAIQAVYNAKAYCRNFDQLNGPQQMAMAQLVYQMGVNLEHFNAFLTTINPGPAPRGQQVATANPQTGASDSAADTQMLAQAMQDATATATPIPAGAIDQSPEYWLGVQQSLMGSQWAHKYRTRAISVIAMLDPAYSDDPTAAEQRVGAVLRPAVVHRRGRHSVAAREVSARSTVRHGKSGKGRHGAARTKGRKRA